MTYRPFSLPAATAATTATKPQSVATVASIAAAPDAGCGADDKRFFSADLAAGKHLNEEAEAEADFAYSERVAIMYWSNDVERAEADVAAAICVAPLAPGETIEQRERVIVHIGEFLDRRRRRAAQPSDSGDAA